MSNQSYKHKYDVFLSHNSADKEVVETIALLLEERGLSPFLDKWHLIPGEPWQEALENALDKSATCAVFIGPQGVGSWENEEMRSALEDRVRSKAFRVIPVLLPDANVSNIDELPRFLRRLTWVDFKSGVNQGQSFELLIAGIIGSIPEHTVAREKQDGLVYLQAGIIHPLPPAPSFTGRKKQLSTLKNFWESGKSSVVSLIGFGGAGKTAIASEFVNAVTGLQNFGYAGENLKLADGCFVWSFYVDQDVNSFLTEAYRYFSQGKEIDAKSGGAIYRFVELLTRGGYYLIVLDGLERIQHSYSDFKHGFGELEDPLLRQLISRLAAGVGKTICLVTSRFPLSDIQVWSARNHFSIAVENLEVDDARALIRYYGIAATDDVINSTISSFGLHALTLDHLCAYVMEFCGGDLAKAKHLDEPNITSVSREERRLARILQAYEKVLDEKELALLSRFCIFRFGTSAETLIDIFTKNEIISGPLYGVSDSEVRRIINRLLKLHLLLEEGKERYTTHPAVKDHFYRLFRNPKQIHDAVRNHYSALAERPGVEKPEDKYVLDLLEELVYHAISAGSEVEAAEIYKDKLGGSRHLGYVLGDYGRGLRVLRAFSQCHSPEDMATYLRATGALKEALSWLNDGLAHYKYPILFLMGYLPQIYKLEKYSQSILHQAALLMGQVNNNRPNSRLFANRLACIVHTHLAFYLGDSMHEILRTMIQAEYSANIHWGFVGNAEQISRTTLSLAELDRQVGKFVGCREKIQDVTPWILNSGSQELLCLLQLTQARLALSEKNYSMAREALTEALHIALNCGFTLYHVDIRNEEARLALCLGHSEEAEKAALYAMNGVLKDRAEAIYMADLPLAELSIMGAAHPECQYVWGVAEASHLLGSTFLEQGKKSQAKIQLQKTLNLRQRINDPRTKHTEQLIRNIS